MNNTIGYQTKENTRRDVGNTSAKRIAKTKCLSNKRKPQLKVKPLGGRSNKTTLNHHPVEANIHKAIKGTTLNHQEFSITQDRSTRRRRRKTTFNHP